MAGNARFHDKLHRKNHHTLPTPGYADSAIDPIASYDEPFQGDFILNGLLSASSGFDILSASIRGDLNCEDITVRGTTYTNFISGQGTETIISDGALTGYGDFTLTLDFNNGIYAKTPKFNVIGSVSSTSDLTVDGKVGIGINPLNEKLTVNGNLEFYGTSATYIKSSHVNGSSLLIFGGSTTGSNSTVIHPFYSLNSFNDRIYADWSYDSIFPYQERKIVYGPEQVTRYFLVSGTESNPILVRGDTSIAGMRGFAYSGDGKFNSYGLGGNASIDLRASGDQSLTNSGGMITFNTMPMNMGTTTGAPERMRITSEGNVGVGVSTPSEKLHVNGNAIVEGCLVLNAGPSPVNPGGLSETQNLTGTYITFQTGTVGTGGANGSGATDWAYLRQIGGWNNFHLVLDMHDDTNQASGLESQAFSIRNVGSSVGDPDPIQTNFTVSNKGFVGVGLDSPISKLHVDGDIRLKNGNFLYLSDVADNTRIRRNTATNGIEFQTDSLTRLFITDGGNIGIGTDNPSERLHVVGNVLVTGNLSALGDTTQIDTNIVTTSAMVIDMLGNENALRITQRGTGNALVVEDEASDTTTFIINSAGNVGVGVIPTVGKMQVDGSITVSTNSYVNFSTNADGHTAIKRNGADNGLDFFTNSTSRMFISDSGNVGIGTKTFLHAPNSKLEVAGNVGSYGYRVNQGNPSGTPSDATTNGYAFGDDGDTGMFSPLDGSSAGAAIGKIGWFCNNVETARTFLNPNKIFTIGGLSATWETYGRNTLGVFDFNNGGIIELSDGSGGRSVIYRDAFTNSLWLEGRTSNSNIVLSTIGMGSITMGVTGSSNGICLNSNGNVGIGTSTPDKKLTINGDVSITKHLFLNDDNYSVIRLGNNDNSGFHITKEKTNNSFNIWNGAWSTSSINRMTILSTGEVGFKILSGSGIRNVNSDADGFLTNATSDGSLKENVSPISQGLNDVLKLNPVSFNWKNIEKYGAQKEIGFIAQEVQPIIPEVIGVNADGKLSLTYQNMVAVLTKAIQELNDKVDAQAKEIEELKNNLSK
jgi:hypothetical protein